MEVSWIVGVIILSLNIFPTYIEGADQCHCANSTECNQYPDGACNSCQQFWSGPNCQIYNIARGDLNTTRLSKGASDPNIVVDGGTDVSVPQWCTKISDETGTTASWTIVFNKRHEIHRMKIYHYTGYADSLKKFEVSVNADLCHRRSNTTIPTSPMDITCGLPLTGDIVSISIPISSFETYTLALCEVEIYECGDHWFGELCDKRCSCVDITEVCNEIDGRCASGTRETTLRTTPFLSTKPPPSGSVTDGLSSASSDKPPQPTAPQPKPAPSGTTTIRPVGLKGTTITPGETAGIVVGVVLVCVVITVGIVIIVTMRRSRRPMEQNTCVNPVYTGTGSNPTFLPSRGPPSLYDRTGQGEDDHTYACIDDGRCSPDSRKDDNYYIDVKDDPISNIYLEPITEHEFTSRMAGNEPRFTK